MHGENASDVNPLGHRLDFAVNTHLQDGVDQYVNASPLMFAIKSSFPLIQHFATTKVCIPIP